MTLARASSSFDRGLKLLTFLILLNFLNKATMNQLVVPADLTPKRGISDQLAGYMMQIRRRLPQ